MSSHDVNPATTRRATLAASAVAALTLVAVWWSARRSLALLGQPREGWFCPAVYPAPPSCYPTWHVQVAAIVTLAVLVVSALVLLAVRRSRRPGLALAAGGLAGLLAWWVAADPNRFLPIW